MASFVDSLLTPFLGDASFFAADLFRECFGAQFPVPRENAGLSISTPPANWRQQVAFYKWPDAKLEVAGFCNWIKYADSYLCGGMCVRPGFYRRLSREHWRECRDRGGIAQIMLETAFAQLTDCSAWFGYCGDKKAYLVDMRAGFQPTRYTYLIAKWKPAIDEIQRALLEDRIAAIGPF
jgi:hypothetical protein